MIKTYTQLVAECGKEIEELFPWDLSEELAEGKDLMLLDIREPYEYEAMHIQDSMNVPRGVLEAACDWDYEETIPELVEARERDIVVICRSGLRSVLAAHCMQMMGYERVRSLKTGLRGWNDYEQPMIDAQGKRVDMDEADEYFSPVVRPEQINPKRRK